MPRSHFFREQDIGFRIRRLRFVIADDWPNLCRTRRSDELAVDRLRDRDLFKLLAPYLDRESAQYLGDIDRQFSRKIARRSGSDSARLSLLDQETDAVMADALAACPKGERRAACSLISAFPILTSARCPCCKAKAWMNLTRSRLIASRPDDARRHPLRRRHRRR